MGVARLMVKAWVIFCLYAGGTALRLSWGGSADPGTLIAAIGLPVLLFLAMGLALAEGSVFLAGHAGLLKGHPRFHSIRDWHCGFNEIVFVCFVLLSFLCQLFLAPRNLSGPLSDALERAVYFAVPGHRVMVWQMRLCMIDGGRIFAASVSWCLALIYLGSALSRLRQSAAVLRLERVGHPDRPVGLMVAALLGLVALAGGHLFYAGAGYALMGCSDLEGISGALVCGLAPLMLAYAVAAALTAVFSRDIP